MYLRPCWPSLRRTTLSEGRFQEESVVFALYYKHPIRHKAGRAKRRPVPEGPGSVPAERRQACLHVCTWLDSLLLVTRWRSRAPRSC